MLEPLQEELSATARAKRLLRVVPHRSLAATSGIGGPELLERRPTGAGRYQDLTESMSAELRESNINVTFMGIDEKADNKAEELKGKGKETVGDATDDRDLQAEGRAQEAKGSLKQAGEKVKDAFKG